MSALLRAGAVAAIALAANLAAWYGLNRPQPELEWRGPIAGVSFNPFQQDEDPHRQRYPGSRSIDADLALIAGHVTKVRTYSSLDGLEQVPALAVRHGVTVTAGAWLGGKEERNHRELVNLVRNARTYRNIDRLIVGNESLLRGDLDETRLIGYLRLVRRQVHLPVSTAEPWHIWLKHPKLAKEVDFIAAHILPYWEGIPAEQAADYVIDRYRQLAAAFPGKPILIAEVGWPSGGNTIRSARPGIDSEAHFLRRFLNAAGDYHLDYFLMEAFDQPWKRADEGEAGAHWGVWDAQRQAKLSFTGAIYATPSWPWQAAAALALSLVPTLWFARRWQRLRHRGQLFFAFLLQGALSLLVWYAALPIDAGLSPTQRLFWLVLLPAQLALLAVVLINGLELTDLLWSRQRRREFAPLPAGSDNTLPKVSLHLAICNEPPELVIATLDSLAGLDYPDFEVLVVDNNTGDPALWEPVSDHCRRLGSRFRFFTLGRWPGYKAGALNFALHRSAPRAAVIGVIDADYLVEPQWLRALVPHFADPAVAIVQAPQEHRDWAGRAFETMINWEYAGFFHIGMVHRNERNAIIQHGTMTLVRKEALQAQGWPEWCICEDAELGLQLLKAAHQAVYVNHPFGRGLTPRTFAGYKGQRFRWAYGAVQILKAHWRDLLPWANNPLTAGQRYHFAAGWLPWFADALHLLFSAATLLWSLGLVLLPHYFSFPLEEYLVPILALFGFRLLHGIWLHRARVPCSRAQTLGATLAGMGLTHTVARAVIKGLFTRDQPFLRTPKAEDHPPALRALAHARGEGIVLGLLLSAAVAVGLSYGTEAVEVRWWLAIIAIQSLPYLAAVMLSLTTALPQNLRSPQRGWRRALRRLRAAREA